MALDSTNIDQSHKSYYSCQSSPKEKKKYKADKKKKNHNFLRITSRLALEAFMAWDKSTKVERNLIKFDSLQILFVRLDSFQGMVEMIVKDDLNYTSLLDIVFRTGPDRKVGPWKPGTGMKIDFLSLKNRIFC